ncbi:hypothetical protein HG530_005140 [Fusarium avenaceum]|nr:hypothetical protein HG530_005140 [Fusarium avenaceum]
MPSSPMILLRRHDALEEPRSEQDGAVAAEGQDEIELLGLAPAQIGGPVLEHVLLSIDIDVDAKVGAIAWGAQQPAGKFTGEVDKLVIAGLCDNHDVANSTLDGAALELLGDFSNTSCGGNEARVRHGDIILDLLQDFANVDGISKSLMVETR